MLNSAGQLAAEFAQSGVVVRVGDPKGAGWGLAFEGYGRNNWTGSPSPAAPQASANRVEYHHGELTEWYVNGPVGLEQGFTLARPPRLAEGHADQPLAIVLALSGDLTASLDSAGTGLTLKQHDGQAVLRYTGLSAQDAAGKPLRCWLELHGSQLLLRINDAGARYPIVVDPYMQATKLTYSLGMAGDQFGCSVAISGNTVVVGAFSVGNGNFFGAVYVFVEPVGGWESMSALSTPTVVLTDPKGMKDDEFGYWVAISGNTIVASALGPNQGAVYVFTAPMVNGAADWSSVTVPTATLTASDGVEEFGSSVAINESGNTIVVGAAGAEIGTNEGQGAAYVFTEPTMNGVTAWANENGGAKLYANDGEARDFFGDSVAISENTVVVGAPGAGTKVGTPPAAPGAAYVFVEPASGVWVTPTTTPTYNAKLTTSGGGVAGDALGTAVAIRGNTVVAGAPGATVGSSAGAGVVEVFELQLGTPPVVGATENESADLTASNAASGNVFFLGGSVSINETGDTVVAGAYGTTILVGVNPYPEQGAAYVFTEPTMNGVTAWSSETEAAQFTSSDVATENLFGLSVGISVNNSVNTVVAGAEGVNSRMGAAYVFVPASAGPGYMFTATTGSGQSAQLDTAFATLLSATVLDNNGNPPTSPVTVTFTALGLAGGASGTFANGTATTTAATNASGVATASVFTANGTAGSYTVAATAPNVTGTADFSLTNLGAPVQTTTTFTTSSSFHGETLPQGVALLGNPVTVNVTVTPASGTAAPTGSVLVTDGGLGDTCVPSPTPLNAGTGSCTLTIATLPSGGVTSLTAAYTPAANSGFLASTSPALAEQVLEIVAPCGAAMGTTFVKQGASTIESFTFCLAGNVTAEPGVVYSVSCLPHGQCNVTITPLAGSPGVYVVSVTITTTAAGCFSSTGCEPGSAGISLLPRSGRWPRNGPWWPLALFALAALLAARVAFLLVRRWGRCPRLAYSAGLILALALAGISGCTSRPLVTPVGTYTINVTIRAGSFSVVVPVTVQVTQ
jgi:hypothetical protein